MPTSQYEQISKIISLIVHLKPKKVLDIGPGFGKYGVLLREYLEFWDTNAQEYDKFKTKIDCIEAYEKYITPIHKYVYNKIIIGDITKKIDEIEEYDLILLIDVIEHFEKEEGKKILKKLLEKAKYVLISTPKYVEEQKDTFGNKYETHRSEWKKKDFKKIAYTFFIKDNQSHIVVLSKNKNIKKIEKEYKIKKIKLYFSNFPTLLKIYYKIKKIFRKKT